MASGYPDWHRGVKSDIIAQTLDKLLIDIVAQSMGNLGVDLKANSVGTLPIDIVASSVGNVPIDIVAQTVGNLGVDLRANSVGTLPIDITASSIEKLPIDIKSQSVGNLGVDLKANSVGTLPIDITASTLGNVPVDISAATLETLGIDIKAQTIDKLGIDIKAQSLSELASGIRTYQAEKTEWIDANSSTTVPSSSWEDVTIRAPAGHIYEITGIYLFCLSPSGATSGKHSFSVTLEAYGIPVLRGESSYNSKLEYAYGRWVSANEAAEPTSDIAQLMVLRGIRIDDTNGIKIRYMNYTNVNQTYTRQMRLYVRKIKVS